MAEENYVDQAQALSQDFDCRSEDWILSNNGPLFCKNSKSNSLPSNDTLPCAVCIPGFDFCSLHGHCSGLAARGIDKDSQFCI